MSLQRRHLWAVLPAVAASHADGARRPLRLTVAYPPGGHSDDVARDIARRLGARIGEVVIVDHRPGAGGAVALEALAQGPADGRALCFSAITPLLHGATGATLRFDPVRDIAPVVAVMHTPVLLLATPALAGQTLDDAVAVARREPGRLRWATSGHGTTGHVVLQQVAATAGVAITHVPYSGGGQQINDALGGQFECLSSNVAARQIALVQEKRLRALAVGAPQRLSVLPDVPTFAELGYPRANLASLFGIFAPGRTPPSRLDALHRELRAVLSQPDFGQRLLDNGNLPAHGTRQEFVRQVALESAAWRELHARPPEPSR